MRWRLAAQSLMLVASALESDAVASQPRFFSSAFSVANLPYAVAVDDLNGDGRADLATANSGLTQSAS
jgi:hypothetical protein